MTKRIDEGLELLLADYQVFYHQLRDYHWNVKGPLFFSLHEAFEAMYGETAEKVDEIAERIAARGGRPSGSLSKTLERARLKEKPASDARSMVTNVVGDLGLLNGHLRELASEAHGQDDTATANLLEGFADAQEKTAWMLRSFLAD